MHFVDNGKMKPEITNFSKTTETIRVVLDMFRSEIPESTEADDGAGHPAVPQHPQDVNFHQVKIGEFSFGVTCK